MCKKKESPAKLIRLGTYAVETIFIKETSPKTFSSLIVISYSPDKIDLKVILSRPSKDLKVVSLMKTTLSSCTT